LRIHLRLAGCYAESRQSKQATREYELASELSPLDVYVLHGLAMCQIEDRDRDAARKTIDRILTLDSDALKWNPEVAGLEGRYWKEEAKAADASGRAEQAMSCYRRALTAYQSALNLEGNGISYYMADNVGQLSLKVGDMDAARDAYTKARRALECEKDNIWSLATGANAALVLGDHKGALARLRQIRNFSPKQSEHASITSGLALIREALGNTANEYASWLQALDG
jgi:tetratricopeptide (TPR) repeat protein